MQDMEHSAHPIEPNEPARDADESQAASRLGNGTAGPGGSRIMVGTVQDVSGHHAATETVGVGEDRYRLLFNSHPLPVWVYDVETLRFLAVNDAAMRRYGWSREEFLQLTLATIRPPEDVSSAVSSIHSERPLTYSMTGPWRHRLRNGSIIWVEAASHPIDFDGHQARMVVLVDVTARREAELALEKSMSLRKVAASCARVGGWSSELPSREMDVSEEAARILGISGSLHFEREGWMPYCAPEYQALVRASIDRAINEGVSFDTEVQLIGVDGKRIWCRLIGEIERDHEGVPVRLLGAVQDMTERKLLEQQYLRAQRMESIGTLAGGMAHDLNNVLAPILLSLEILRQPMPLAERRDVVDTIETSARHGAEMIKHLLMFARGVDGRRMNVSIKTLLHHVERLSADVLPRNINLEVLVDERTPAVLGDPTQLHQVLLNLIVNARDAMPDGGRLSLTAEPVDIDENFIASDDVRPGSYAVLSVEDSGVGISPEHVRQIFDPFFTTKEIGVGTGLGLPTSEAIVRSHGGFIRVYSEPDCGTAFKVYLPAASGDAQGEQAKKNAGALPHGHGELILVVDDEAAVARIARQILERFGYRVMIASNGAEAISAFLSNQHGIALVLIDMMMPVMDGRAAIQALRRISPEVRIVAASGLTGYEKTSVTEDISVSYLLEKPYSARTLLTTIRSVLDNVPSRQ